MNTQSRDKDSKDMMGVKIDNGDIELKNLTFKFDEVKILG